MSHEKANEAPSMQSVSLFFGDTRLDTSPESTSSSTSDMSSDGDEGDLPVKPPPSSGAQAGGNVVVGGGGGGANGGGANGGSESPSSSSLLFAKVSNQTQDLKPSHTLTPLTPPAATAPSSSVSRLQEEVPSPSTHTVLTPSTTPGGHPGDPQPSRESSSITSSTTSGPLSPSSAHSPASPSHSSPPSGIPTEGILPPNTTAQPSSTTSESSPSPTARGSSFSKRIGRPLRISVSQELLVFVPDAEDDVVPPKTVTSTASHTSHDSPSTGRSTSGWDEVAGDQSGGEQEGTNSRRPIAVIGVSASDTVGVSSPQRPTTHPSPQAEGEPDTDSESWSSGPCSLYSNESWSRPQVTGRSGWLDAYLRPPKGKRPSWGRHWCVLDGFTLSVYSEEITSGGDKHKKNRPVGMLSEWYSVAVGVGSDGATECLHVTSHGGAIELKGGSRSETYKWMSALQLIASLAAEEAAAASDCGDEGDSDGWAAGLEGRTTRRSRKRGGSRVGDESGGGEWGSLPSTEHGGSGVDSGGGVLSSHSSEDDEGFFPEPSGSTSLRPPRRRSSSSSATSHMNERMVQPTGAGSLDSLSPLTAALSEGGKGKGRDESGESKLPSSHSFLFGRRTQRASDVGVTGGALNRSPFRSSGLGSPSSSSRKFSAIQPEKLSGVLEKKAHNSLRRWISRWYVLNVDKKTLMYWDTQGNELSGEPPKAVLYEVKEVFEDGASPVEFKIIDNQERVSHFRASSMEERQRWLDAVRK